MGLSVREMRLVETLLRHPEGLTADGIADQLGVSARTIHRDLQPVSEFLDSQGLSLVRQSGRGLRVEGENGAWESAREALRGMESSALTPERRRLSLIRELLAAGEPVKLRALASGMKVSVGTVSRDLDEVEEWVTGFRLSLLRKPGYGVEVVGAERDIRRAMSHIIFQNLDETALLSRRSREDKASDSVTNRLMGMIDEERLRRVEALTAGMVESLPYALADSAFVGMSVHIALMVERLLQGGEVELDGDTLQSLREASEYEHARNLAKAVEEEFGIDVPEEEVAFVTMHLLGAKLRDDDALERYFEDSDLEVASKVNALVHYVEEETGDPLAGDSVLYTGLLAHTERAIHRLRNRMGIYNPLLAEVKQDYPALFDLVSRGMEKVFANEEIPEEETGFVAMHFGAALDRGQESFPRHILIVCSAGIGSARMLASRLEKAFPQIQAVRNASLFDLEDINTDGFDLVVSTVPLPMPDDAYVQVQPFLSDIEIESIRNHLRERSLGSRPTYSAASESLEMFGGGHTRFHQMAEATQTIADLIDEVFLESQEARGDVREAVRRMCASLAERGLVTEPEPLEDGLLARIELGGIGIPGTVLALFHARDDAVVRPAFSAHDFDQPLEMEGMDGETMRVRRSLLMIAPQELSPVALEAISEISVAMVERPEERRVLENGSEARIVSILQNIFARYLQHKLV